MNFLKEHKKLSLKISLYSSTFLLFFLLLISTFSYFYLFLSEKNSLTYDLNYINNYTISSNLSGSIIGKSIDITNGCKSVNDSKINSGDITLECQGIFPTNINNDYLLDVKPEKVETIDLKSDILIPSNEINEYQKGFELARDSLVISN